VPSDTYQIELSRLRGLLDRLLKSQNFALTELKGKVSCVKSYPSEVSTSFGTRTRHCMLAREATRDEI
jgi:hypothetical protein